MKHLPAFLDIRDRTCIVVGGGPHAVRKAELLLRSGARVRVHAEQLEPGMQALVTNGAVEHEPLPFRASHLQGAALVAAASGDTALDMHVAFLARERGIPANIADRPEWSTLIFPSIVDRSPLVIAVSSGGASPILARLLRSRLEVTIPAAFGRLAELADEFRAQVRARFRARRDRRRFWERVFGGPIAEKMLSGQSRAAREEMTRALAAGDIASRGEVYLVGAGPGSADLLTLRALRLMQQADVVLHDHLVSAEVLELVHADAERIYVGKEDGNHALPQEEINALLVELAHQGQRVLRLKGGDPFMFGRGGEEIEALAAHAIPFEVVPGITSAAGASSYAGIPLTHRDYAQSCTFVTGHRRSGSGERHDEPDWMALARPNQTVVVYMGVGTLATTARRMIEHGRAAETPAAVIERATAADQRVVTGTLATLPDLAKARAVKPPALLIIGEVVALHERLNWFDPAGSAAPSIPHGLTLGEAGIQADSYSATSTRLPSGSRK
jgi:uroporphyrin-III C-methyltransferase/precorrin-2 dehydrogenase/sirohydrochlorin ferrochelatase